MASQGRVSQEMPSRGFAEHLVFVWTVTSVTNLDILDDAAFGLKFQALLTLLLYGAILLTRIISKGLIYLI